MLEKLIVLEKCGSPLLLTKILKKMSSGSLGLTVAQLESCINYPKRKRIFPPAPISDHESRKWIQQYKRDVAASHRPRNTMSTTVAKKPEATVASSAFFMERYEQAMEAGLLNDALGAIREALRLGEVTVDVFVKLATIHELQGDYENALDNWTDAIALDPMFHDAYEHRADCYVSLGDPHSALVEMEKYLKLEPASKSLLVKTGKCALDAKKFEVAEKYFHDCLTLEPQLGPKPTFSGFSETADGGDGDVDDDASHEAYALFNLGDLEEQRGDNFRAKAHYAAVLKRDPKFCEPYLEAAEEEFAAGNWHEALRQFQSVSKVLSRSELVMTRLADTYEQLGPDFSVRVISCLTDAIQVSSDIALKLSNLVRRGRLMLTAQNDVDAAIADFSLCLSLDPNYVSALLNRAHALRVRSDVGDVAAAVADYKHLVTLPGLDRESTAEPYRFIACAAFDQEDYAEAGRCFALASAAGCVSKDDELQRLVSMAYLTVQEGKEFELLYEQRPWNEKKEEDANAKKKAKPDKDAFKPFPVTSVMYSLIDAHYVELRSREPTMHNALEYLFIDIWKPFRDQVEGAREAADVGKGKGKNKPAPKK